MLSACTVICVSFGLIQTAPLNYKDAFYPNYDSVDYNEMVRATRNLIPNSGPEKLFLKPSEANSNSNDASVYREGNDIIRLPTLASEDLDMLDPLPPSNYFEHGIRAALPLEYGFISQTVPSRMWNTKYLRIPYEADQDIYEKDPALNFGPVNIEMDPYEVDLYPYVHTSIAAALNPLPPVNSLPPVYATDIHETLPYLETNADYDIDVLNPENSELLPPNLRITRSQRKDLLNELVHEAMLNNNLPTMPVPFVRGAESSPSYQVPQLAQPTGHVMAVYPTSRANDCAIPILLGCSPHIVRGTMPSTYAEQSPQIPHLSYREAEQIYNNALRQDNL